MSGDEKYEGPDTDLDSDMENSHGNLLQTMFTQLYRENSSIFWSPEVVAAARTVVNQEDSDEGVVAKSKPEKDNIYSGLPPNLVDDRTQTITAALRNKLPLDYTPAASTPSYYSVMGAIQETGCLSRSNNNHLVIGPKITVAAYDGELTVAERASQKVFTDAFFQDVVPPQELRAVIIPVCGVPLVDSYSTPDMTACMASGSAQWLATANHHKVLEYLRMLSMGQRPLLHDTKVFTALPPGADRECWEKKVEYYLSGNPNTRLIILPPSSDGVGWINYHEIRKVVNLHNLFKTDTDKCLILIWSITVASTLVHSQLSNHPITHSDVMVVHARGSIYCRDSATSLIVPNNQELYKNLMVRARQFPNMGLLACLATLGDFDEAQFAHFYTEAGLGIDILYQQLALERLPIVKQGDQIQIHFDSEQQVKEMCEQLTKYNIHTPKIDLGDCLSDVPHGLVLSGQFLSTRNAIESSSMIAAAVSLVFSEVVHSTLLDPVEMDEFKNKISQVVGKGVDFPSVNQTDMPNFSWVNFRTSQTKGEYKVQ